MYQVKSKCSREIKVFVFHCIPFHWQKVRVQWMGRMKGNIFMQCSEQILLSMKQGPICLYAHILHISKCYYSYHFSSSRTLPYCCVVWKCILFTVIISVKERNVASAWLALTFICILGHLPLPVVKLHCCSYDYRFPPLSGLKINFILSFYCIFLVTTTNTNQTVTICLSLVRIARKGVIMLEESLKCITF